MYNYVNFEYVLVNDGCGCCDPRPSGGCSDPCAASSTPNGGSSDPCGASSTPKGGSSDPCGASSTPNGGGSPGPAAVSCGSMEKRNGLQECCL